MISTGSNYYFWSIEPKRFWRYQNRSNQPGQLRQRAAVTLTWTDCWWANMSTDLQDALAPLDSANSTMTFTRTFIHYLVLYRNIPVITGEVNRGWSTVPWQHMANLCAKWRMKHVSVTLSQFTAIKDVASTVANSVDLTVQPSTTTLTLISTTLALALLEMCGQNKIIAIWGHAPLYAKLQATPLYYKCFQTPLKCCGINWRTFWGQLSSLQ